MEDFVRKKLQSISKYNPFNESFNYNELINFISTIDSKDNLHSKQIALCSKCYNEYYKEIHGYIKENFKKLNYDVWGTIQTIFAISNREYYLLDQKIREQTGPLYGIEKLSKLETKSSLKHFGEVNLISLVEVQVDIINTIINTLKHYDINNSSKLIEERELVPYLTRIFTATNLLYCLKSSYDVALWEKRYIDIIDESIYHIKYENLELPKAMVIGGIRMQNNMLATLEALDRVTTKNGDFNNFIFDANLTSNLLDRVWIDNKGYIQYSLKKGKNTIKNTNHYARAFNEIFTYYPYITDSQFENFENLNIQDLLTLFSEISSIICLITKNNMLNKIDDNNLCNFSYKIKKRNLVKFLKQRTQYKKNQILYFLNILESSFVENKRIDFWKKPLFLFEDDYYFLSVNLTAPNYSFLVDEWLKVVGYDLEKRGKDFEVYIKKEFNNLLNEKGYSFIIPNKSKFYINYRHYEEIDLLIVLKSIVILAEVKCIKYPMDSRDIHNNLKILEKAGIQAKRKADFISNNERKFINDIGDISGKEIISVIITNYPIFAGAKVNNIPIIDYYLFDSFFGSGMLTHSVRLPSGDTISSKNEYYKNEDELNAKLKDFIENPPSIKEIEQNLTAKTQEITLPNAMVHIYQDIIC